LLTAVAKSSNPSRLLLQQTLSNSNFKAMGATGMISFQGNGDRKEPQIQLVQVQLDKQGKPVFISLQTTR
jgi:ABC-type branched-subunit amino acid transport system substrate-binding protein